LRFLLIVITGARLLSHRSREGLRKHRQTDVLLDIPPGKSNGQV
jgi:hypothetical protein